jgi:hypothetical protein
MVCTAHVKTTGLKKPIKINLNKKKQDLIAFCLKHKITHDATNTKPMIQDTIKEYMATHCLEEIEKKHAGKTDDADIGRAIMCKFDALFLGKPVQIVLIENQIGPLAIKMSKIQGMLCQYFVMRFPGVQIEIVNSTCKLSGYKSRLKAKAITKVEVEDDGIILNQNNICLEDDGILTNKEEKKGGGSEAKYKDRKSLGKEICVETLESVETLNRWQPYFQSFPKKDDLADCFLQAMWYINKEKEKEKEKEKNKTG